jgi:Double-GTPase 2
MFCPYCLIKLQTSTRLCTACQHQLPPEYVKCHSNWFSRAPAIVSVIGFSGHGKTVYLASLYYVLQNIVTRSWKAFFRQGWTMKTLETIHDNVAMLKRGDLPQPTDWVFPEPNIDRLFSMPYFGNRTLLVYDPKGEAFDLHVEEENLQRFAGFVKHSRCALFLMSLTDLEEFGGDEGIADEMYKLLERYNVGMTHMGAPDRFQHLIVVYTKADRLLSYSGFPDEVSRYLEKSESESLHDVRAYLNSMKRNSALLRDFTSETLNGRGFLSNAQTHFKSVEFCAVSALGSEPVGTKLSERVMPRRVIDPLLWVLQKCGRR